MTESIIIPVRVELSEIKNRLTNLETRYKNLLAMTRIGFISYSVIFIIFLGIPILS